MKRLYLDDNAQCQALPSVKDKVSAHLSGFGNPSSFHREGQEQRRILDDAREYVANALQAGEREIIFTSGASEANRLFIDALKETYRAFGRVIKISVSPYEHPSLLKPLLKMADEKWCEVSVFSLDEAGALVLDKDIIASSDIVMLTTAHNETGILSDIEYVANQLRPDAVLMSDVAQSLARISHPHARIDVLTASAQKIGAYAGAGALVLRRAARGLKPPWIGGGQEKGFRPGTEPLLLIAGFGEAARHINELRDHYKKIATLRDAFEVELKQCFKVRIIGERLPRLPNTSAVTFLEKNPDALRIQCDLAGLSVGFGSACSGLAPEGSFALNRMGLSIDEQKCTVRFSFSHEFSMGEMIETIERLKGFI